MSTTANERRNVAILAATQALYLITTSTVMTLSGLVGQRLTPEPALSTLPVAGVMVGVVLTSLPASLLMKRFGRKAGFLTGAAAGAAGGAVSVAGIAAESFVVFVVGSLLIGSYQAFANYYRFAAADAASPAFQPRAISLVLGGGVIAAFLGPLNASRATNLVPGVTDAGPYAVILGLAILAAGLHLLLRIPNEQEAREGVQRPLGEIVRNPALGVAVLAGTVAYASMVLVMTATPLAMQGAGFDLPQAATVMQWHVLGMFVPSFFTGRIIARVGVARVLHTGSALLLASIATAVSGQALWQFWLALVLLGVAWNLLFVGGSTLLADTHLPAERGKIQGLNELVVFSAVALGSLLAGALLHAIGWERLNLLVLPFAAMIIAATVWWQRRHLDQAAPARVEAAP